MFGFLIFPKKFGIFKSIHIQALIQGSLLIEEKRSFSFFLNF